MSYFERLVALNVIDEGAYQRYRAGTADLLREFGGDRRYDFRVSEALLSATEHPVNRVFLIRFPDKAAMDGFFSDPRYRAVREEHFGPAVSGATVLAAYESG